MELLPTRWRRAKNDWRGVQGKREIIVAFVGAAVGAVALLIAGFGHDAVVVGITIGGSALAAAVIVPTLELWWSWLQAPMRQLTDEVVAIRKALGARPSQTPIRLPRAVNNYVRRGRTLLMMEQFSEQDASNWANAIGSILDEHGDYEDAARFSLARGAAGSVYETLKAQIAVLDEIGERLEKHWGQSVRKGG